MRTTLLTGLALIVGGVAVILLSSPLELDLEPTALMGAAIGAALALIPDRAPFQRLSAFLVGFAAAWVGYLVRAAVLPDTSGGDAVALALVVVLCVGVAAATVNRLPLWASLLGAAALSGGYEYTYALAPSEVLDTSTSAMTTILISVAVGLLAASFVAPKPAAGPSGEHRRAPTSDDPHDDVPLDQMMRTTR